MLVCKVEQWGGCDLTRGLQKISEDWREYNGFEKNKWRDADFLTNCNLILLKRYLTF